MATPWLAAEHVQDSPGRLKADCKALQSIWTACSIVLHMICIHLVYLVYIWWTVCMMCFHMGARHARSYPIRGDAKGSGDVP